MTCFTPDKEAACGINKEGSQISLWEHTIYNPSGTIFAIYYTRPGSVGIFDASDYDVSSGGCSTPDPDVEIRELCETLADGTIVQFERHIITRFMPDGTPIVPNVINNYLMDGTVYTVVDENNVGKCECVDKDPVGLITDFADLGGGGGK